ncbi:mitotic checkpoint serine/threonine-protein kinase BUB1-like [Elysia marginata]|uniref:Mitotic checkpoint serine/threonine-protein kinase BUB1-like n=1 Tax=Elysia marginata TaxID=1093978 RepID=A0AAV4EE12_9GAST|nr:mitotic checkpoint serine/threonine-protein kinase BUB1-like [Elysia marginata]
MLEFKRPLVKLIDFGQSIDMTMFPPETTFTAKIHTSGFQCIEMKTNRPWTYQTDLFGLAGTIHVVLFGSYMNVFQEHGVWRTTGNFVRKWNTPLWKQLFHELLNVPSCWHLPDLAALRQEFEKYFHQKLTTSYASWVRRLHLDLNSS